MSNSKAIPSSVKFATITAEEWRPDTEAYLFAETGEGALYRVDSIRPDCWIVTVGKDSQPGHWMTSSWCCHLGTRLYVFPDRANRDLAEHALQSDLADRRDQSDAESLASRIGGASC
jgi:hypothetical protein